jgi:uncharacterized membrane protein
MLDQGILLGIEQVLFVITRVIELIAVIVMLWGVVLFVREFPKAGFRRKAKLSSLKQAQIIRCQLGTYILLALELMIVADVIHSIVSRTWESLAILAGIVAIRTALSFFLGREIETVDRDIKG